MHKPPEETTETLEMMAFRLTVLEGDIKAVVRTIELLLRQIKQAAEHDQEAA